MVKKYQKKPITIEAIYWNGSEENFNQIKDFCPSIIDGGAVWHPDAPDDAEVKTTSWPLFIETLEGIMCASMGDYIIKGVKGEFYPCKGDIFEETYQIIE